MNIPRVNDLQCKLLSFLQKQDFKPDEKMAALRSTADLIQQVLNAETNTKLMRMTLEKFL